MFRRIIHEECKDLVSRPTQTSDSTPMLLDLGDDHELPVPERVGGEEVGKWVGLSSRVTIAT